MVFNESLNSVYYGICNAADISKRLGIGVLKEMGFVQNRQQEVAKLPPNLQNLNVSNLIHSGGPIVRIAALSGAMAVVLGAYGAHTLPLKEDYKDRKEVYHTANRYHFFHSLALLGVPMCRFPGTAAAFMSLGMVLFCGTCYYQAFTGDKNLRKLTPIGGTCLILGWLCMML